MKPISIIIIGVLLGACAGQPPCPPPVPPTTPGEVQMAMQSAARLFAARRRPWWARSPAVYSGQSRPFSSNIFLMPRRIISLAVENPIFE